MTNDKIADISQEVRQYYDRYTGKLHVMRMALTIFLIALAILLSSFMGLLVTAYINVSRDTTVIKAELNINAALDELKNIAADPKTEPITSVIMRQEQLWNEQAILLSQIEKKVPKPDWFASFTKFIGWLSALGALFIGMSSMIIAWRNERRATASFMLDMKQRLEALEEMEQKVIVP